MSLRKIKRFADLIPEIRAQERLEEATVAIMPHLDKRARMDIARAWIALISQPEAQKTPRSHDRAWDSLRALVRRR